MEESGRLCLNSRAWSESKENFTGNRRGTEGEIGKKEEPPNPEQPDQKGTTHKILNKEARKESSDYRVGRGKPGEEDSGF